jgi:hypothetical protein
MIWEKAFAFSLVFCLLFVSMFGFVTVSADIPVVPPDYVRVEVDKVLVLRGGTLNISTYGNFSSFEQQIIAPNGAVIYDEVRSSNMSFTVPTSAYYGTYTIASIAGSSVSETEVTVLDIQNWLPASFPYMRSWQNVNYVFCANGSVIATNNAGDNLNVDLSMIRNLISTYGLNAQVYYNSMNFRVRLSKDSITVDLTFSFIHAGCKFTINGTLDKPRDFTFSVANPQKLKHTLSDIIRSGNLVFDWGDISKAGQAFSYNNGVLTISVPRTFSLDPTIFSDGFESGDFSAWTSSTIRSGDNMTVESNNPHHGTYNAKLEIKTTGEGWAYYNKNFLPTNYTTLYYRTYFKSDSNVGGTNGNLFNIMQLTTSVGTIARVFWTRESGSAKWHLNYLSAPATYSDLYNATPAINTGQWYCIEVTATIGDGAGSVALYVDETQIISASSLDNDEGGDLNYAVIGCTYSTGQTVTAYYDCVLVSDSYIGSEESDAPTFSAVTSNSTVSSSAFQFSCNVSDGTAVDYVIPSTNNTGSWVNSTALDASDATSYIANVTGTLNNTVGNVVSAKFYANDTLGNEDVSSQYNFTVTADTYTVTLSGLATANLAETVWIDIAISRATETAVSNWALNITNNDSPLFTNYGESTFSFSEEAAVTHTFNVTGLYDVDASAWVTPTCEALSVAWQSSGSGGSGGSSPQQTPTPTIPPGTMPSPTPWNLIPSPEDTNNFIVIVIIACVAIIVAILLVSYSPEPRKRSKRGGKSPLGSKKRKGGSIL